MGKKKSKKLSVWCHLSRSKRYWFLYTWFILFLSTRGKPLTWDMGYIDLIFTCSPGCLRDLLSRRFLYSFKTFVLKQTFFKSQMILLLKCFIQVASHVLIRTIADWFDLWIFQQASKTQGMEYQITSKYNSGQFLSLWNTWLSSNKWHNSSTPVPSPQPRPPRAILES